MNNPDQNQSDKPSWQDSSNNLNPNLISNDSQHKETDSHVQTQFCNFDQVSLDLARAVRQIENISESKQTAEHISQNIIQVSNSDNNPEHHSGSIPIPNTNNNASSLNNQANGHTIQNGLQVLESEKKIEEPSYLDGIHDINRTVNALGNNQTNEETRNEGQTPKSEKKLEGPSCYDLIHDINKTANALRNNQINADSNISELQSLDPGVGPQKASWNNSANNINSDLHNTLHNSANNQVNHQANEGQTTSEETKMDQIQQMPQQKRDPPNKPPSSSLHVLVEMLKGNSQNENRVSYVFGDNELPDLFSNEAIRRELEKILESKFSEIVRTSKRIDQISMKKTEEEKEEQKLSENEDFQSGDFTSALSGYELIEVLGSGLHGVVYRAKNQEGNVKAIKTYIKKNEKEFITEVAVLSMISVHDFGGEVGIDGIFETKDHYGVILTSGMGTLFDLKKFLQKEQISLSEVQLLGIFQQIYDNFTYFARSFLAHRDIKPTNIIVSISDDRLDFEIIDYSLALSLKSKKFSIAGTPGYIDPYLLKNYKNLTALDFLFGDLFSIGVTLLELALPNFQPKQNDTTRIKHALKKLEKEKPIIFSLLSSLFNEEKYQNKTDENMMQYFAELDQLLKDFENQIPLEGRKKDYLAIHCANFHAFLINEVHKKQHQTEKLLKNQVNESHSIEDEKDIKDNENQNYLKAIGFTKKKTYQGSSMILDMFAVQQSLDYFFEMNDLVNQMLCIENLLKNSIQIEDFNAIENYSNLLLDLAGGLDKSQLEKFLEPHFLFSTLGVANYKLSNFEKACKLFEKGLEVMMIDHEGDQMIIVNNLACAFSMIEGKQQEANKRFLEAYSPLEKHIESFAFDSVKRWSNFQASNLKSTDLVKIGNDQPSRSFDFMLLSEKSVPKDWKEPIEDPINFFFIIFQNYCFNKAQNLLTSLENEQEENQLEDLMSISYSFSLQNSAAIRLDFELQLSLNLFKLASIFKEVKADSQQEQRFIQESQDLLERKEVLIGFYQEKKLDLLSKELNKSELLFYLVGFGNIFRSVEQQGVKIAIESIVQDVEKYLNKLEVKVNTVQAPFSFARAFSRYFETKNISVSFQEINDSANELIKKEEKIMMSLIPEELVQSHCLQSCGYRMTFSQERSCSKLTLNSLDLSYMPGFSSHLNKEDLESLTLEIKDQNIIAEENTELSQDLTGLKLKRLELYFTLFAQFSDHSFKSLAEALATLSELQELQIVFGWGDASEFTIEYLEKALPQLKKLQELSLIFGYHSSLTDDQISSFAKTLCELENLQDISLHFYACTSISFTETQKVQDMLSAKKKNATVLVSPMRVW